MPLASHTFVARRSHAWHQKSCKKSQARPSFAVDTGSYSQGKCKAKTEDNGAWIWQETQKCRSESPAAYTGHQATRWKRSERSYSPTLGQVADLALQAPTAPITAETRPVKRPKDTHRQGSALHKFHDILPEPAHTLLPMATDAASVSRHPTSDVDQRLYSC